MQIMRGRNKCAAAVASGRGVCYNGNNFQKRFVMYEKLFARYGRAVADARERKSLYSLFCAGIIAAVVFLVLTVAFLITVLAMPDYALEESFPAAVAVLALLALWVVSVVTVCVLWAVFGFTYRRILKRAPAAGEPREVVNYRKNQENPALHAYKYLFPDAGLYAEAEAVRQKYTKIISAGLIVCAVAAVAVAAVFLFVDDYIGYAMPAVFTIIFGGIIVFSLLPKRRLDDIERRQKSELENNPEYALNLEWYKVYQDFYRFKGKLYIIFAAVGIALGWVLAALFPASAWSLLTSVPVVAGLAVNNKFFNEMREKAAPIERDIDRVHALREGDKAAESVQANEGNTPPADVAAGGQFTPEDE